jgi:hypothetical protein
MEASKAAHGIRIWLEIAIGGPISVHNVIIEHLQCR